MNLLPESTFETTTTILTTTTESSSSSRGSILCSKDALTDQFGWTVQTVLAVLAFTCLVCKTFFLMLSNILLMLNNFLFLYFYSKEVL